MKIAIVLLLLVSLAVSLVSCGVRLRLEFEDGSRYQVGEFRDVQGIQNLDVEWVSGSVRVIADNVSGISAAESSSDKIPLDLVMRYWVDGETLHIRFGKDGARLKNNFQKDLVITVPEKAFFFETKIESASADIIFPKINADYLDISSASGTIEAAGSAGKIRLETVSGNIRAEFSGFDSAQADSVSGDIDCLMLTEGSVSLGSTSGNIRTQLNGVPDVKAESVSGSIVLSLEKGTGFTAKLDTLSGDISSDFPVSQKGDKYISGDGAGEIKASTTSGDISLKQA